MENYNLTNIILSNIQSTLSFDMDSKRLSITRFFLNQSLINLLGDYEIKKDNVDLIIRPNKDGSVSVDIDYIHVDSMLVITIMKENDTVRLLGTLAKTNETVLKMDIMRSDISNRIEYEEEDTTVIEGRQVFLDDNGDIEHVDLAIDDGSEKLYVGRISPMYTKTSNNALYQYEDISEPREKESFLKSLADGVVKGTVFIPATTSIETADYLEEIYGELKTRYQQTRKKKDVKVRKRVDNNKKNENK